VKNFRRMLVLGVLLSSTPILSQNGDTYTANERTLQKYYSLRSFDGAPPVIPHPIEKEVFGGKACLKCHQNGDYAPKWKGHAPVTPHPELVSCRQCHVARTTKLQFVKQNFRGKQANRNDSKPTLKGSPLLIPHSLFMREKCLSCHAGKATVTEIRTTHPERTSCLQCHLAPVY